MNWLNDFLSHDPVREMGWTLIHSLWQGTFFAFLLAVALAAIPKRMPNIRYSCACLALLAMLAAFCTTVWLIVPQDVSELDITPWSDEVTVEAEAARRAEPLTPITAAEQPYPLAESFEVDNAIQTPAPSRPWRRRLADALTPRVGYLVCAWLIGIFSLSAWNLGAWIAVRRLRFIGTKPLPDRFVDLAETLAARFSVKRSVRLLQSTFLKGPMTIGWLKPIVLVPASVLSELSPDQIEAILAHELAHIRRHDYLINFLQTIVETLLFHHPAVWWISHKIRSEREYCCDDAVVQLPSDQLNYAQALKTIAEMRRNNHQLAIAAGGGPLPSRIQRILGMKSESSLGRNHPSIWVLMVLVVIVAVLALPLGRNNSNLNASPHEYGAGKANSRAKSGAESDTTTVKIAGDLHIKAFIDGKDTIKIRDDRLWYEHHTWDLPGKWWNRLENIKYDEPTYIDGEAWKPEWEGRISKPYIMKQVTLPREVNDHINLTKISGRGSVSIAETPKPENDYTLSILLDDNLYNKAQWYELVIQWGLRETPEKRQAKTGSKSSIKATSHPEGTGNLLVRVTGKGIKAHWGVQAYPIGKKMDDRDRIDSSWIELNHYVFRGLKEGDYVVMAPIPFGIAGVNGKATVQLNGCTQATVEPGKDIRAEIEFQENAGIRGAFQCPDKNLSWRIILLDGADKSCGSSSAEITQAHALGWKLERSGFYEINYLSPGTYTIIGRICKKGENWIPVKEKKKTVTVGDGEMAVVDFNFSSEPGDVSISTSPALNHRSKTASGQAKVETADIVALSGEEGKVLAFDDFDGSLSLDWEILHKDPTHYSLTKKPGTLTITTQEGGFAWSGLDYENLFLIDCPASPRTDFQITTSISGFNPDAPWQQAGLVFWNDDDYYLKWVCQFGTNRTFSYLGETNAIRKSHRGFAVPQGVDRFWLRMTKWGNRYEFLTSLDGKSFVPFNAPTDPHGKPMTGGALTWGESSVKKIGLFVANGLDSRAPEIDASFEFFEVRIYQAEAEPQSESVKN